jgi:hypothetical protein
MKRLFLLAICTPALAACASRWNPMVRDEPASPATAWATTLRNAEQLVAAGRYAAADSALASFAAAYPGTQFARETAFWRALYRLDPRNRTSRKSEALAALDAYVLDESVWWYDVEAEVLRQVARGRPIAEPTFAAGDTSGVAVAAKDREIQQLRARIAELSQELDRIKARLATPP